MTADWTSLTPAAVLVCKRYLYSFNTRFYNASLLAIIAFNDTQI